MAFTFDKLLGVHDDALLLRSKRTELIASNLANADTPGYKAQDLDFKQALSNAQIGKSDFKMQTTNEGHISGKGFSMNSDIKFRQISQPSVDGNTVDTHIEKAAFAKNSLEYQATLRFLNGKFSSLKSVLKAQ